MTPEQIRELRAKLGMKQELLAHNVGVTFSTYNRWENGHRKPSPMAVRRLKEIEVEYERGKNEHVT